MSPESNGIYVREMIYLVINSRGRADNGKMGNA